MAAVRETIAHLYSLGRFQEVSVEALRGAGRRPPRLHRSCRSTASQRIEFTGNLGLDSGQLRTRGRGSLQRHPLGDARGQRRRDAAGLLLRSWIPRRGHPSGRRGQARSRRTILTFEIESGPRASVRNVIVEGDPLQPRETIPRPHSCGAGRAYQRIDVQEQLSEYVDRQMHRQGRYEAQGSHRILAQSDDGQSVDLLGDDRSGPAISIRFEGDPLPLRRVSKSWCRSAGGCGRRRHHRRLRAAHRRLPAAAGLLEGQRDVRRREREVRCGRDRVHDPRGPAIPDRRRRRGEPATRRSLGGAAAGLQNLEDGEIFTAANLDAVAVAIRGIYLRRGFAQVKVESALDEATHAAG